MPRLFSIEMWGGATFDTSMRFLEGISLAAARPTCGKDSEYLFQMLLRGVQRRRLLELSRQRRQEFVQESAAAGIDLFRIFDSLNWVPNMQRRHGGRA